MKNKIISFFFLFAVFIAINIDFVYAINPDEGKQATNRNLQVILDFFNGEFILNLLFAIVTIILTIALSKWIPRKASAYMEKRMNVDGSTNEGFLSVMARTLSVLIIVVGFSASITIMGFDMSIFIGGIGFGIGFTLKVFLTNFIAGIITATQGTYSVGDLVDIGGKMGKIKKIYSLYTSVERLDGVVYFVPNIRFLEDGVSNYYSNSKRRVEVEVLLDYKTDIYKAKNIMIKVSEQFPEILKLPASKVIVNKLSDKGILLTLRFWINSDSDYFMIKSNVTETVNLMFKKYDIIVPYRIFNFKNIEKINQKDLNILQEDKII